ncbi:PAS domain-containing protein [Marinobacterium aestuariivivens]|uniref:PAS domain-containing protein n=1 Tax=Marinobacterium aestuariivivens TaxID=1698799 RepID=A0ABW1ZZD9_9GAMM
MALLDPEAPGKRRLLFSGGDGFAPAELEQAVAGNDLPILVRSEVRLGERAWELVQYARNDFIETPWALFYLLSGGFLLSGVYCWLILVLAGQRNHVQLQVAEQTRQLAISNSLLAEAKRIAGLSHWVWYPREQRHHWSVPFCKLIGDDELGARASVEAFVARLLPHCQEEVAARIGFWVHGRGASSQPLVCELEPVAGHRRHIELQSDWIQNDQGEAEYLSIVAQDITERWQGQEQLRLAAATFEGQDAILITDVHGDIRRVNGAFERLLGYPQSLVQGRNPRIFRTGRHDHDFYRRLWQRVAERGYWQGEIWNLHRDGSERLLRASITAVKGASGSTSHYVASYSDITDQRTAEEQIRRLAYYDSLTGLPNRDLFHENLRQQIAQGVAAATSAPCCSSISTTSRASTIPSATVSATSCCVTSPAGCGTGCGSRTSSAVLAATSS